MPDAPEGHPIVPPSLLALFFASGFAGLVYQVLWLRQLALLFGSTAHAAALTLAIFFLGLSLGSYWWGERAAQAARPLRAYAMLEVGIAVTALLYFGLFDLYHTVYASLFRAFSDRPLAFTLVKAALATTMLLPPAICMGGTLPMMGQHLVRRPEQLGAVATLLYALNTAGGACGALAAGFYLPAVLGFANTYWLSIALSTAIGLGAFALDRRMPVSARPAAEPNIVPAPPPFDRRAVLAIAFLSGFTTLALEVLWTRMFAQVLHNSVYSFAAILVTFLIALGLGAAVAHRLCRSAADPVAVVAALALAAGTAVGLSPFLFYAFTDGLSYVAPQAGWLPYMRAVFTTAVVVMLPAAVLAGSLFPYLLQVARAVDTRAGAAIGRLAAVNTAGAILGSLGAGFVLLQWLGLWASIKAMALLYFVAAGFALELGRRAPGTRSVAMRIAPAAGMLLFATALDPSRLPMVKIDSRRGEALFEVWEGAHGVVAVVQQGKSRRIKLDNYYSLGGTGALTYEQTQADIPIFIHPHPRSVFFLGMGTGITAGAALQHPVERVTTAELIPEVVTAARVYFGSYTGGLFSDPRSRIVVEDGRHYLSGTAETYDVIVGDLFIPWQAGAGSLYTLEHFAAVRARLAPGGLFAQWLPLYQLSQGELEVIARTMLEVFPQLTLWRGDFLPDRPIVALVGQAAATPLAPERLVDNFRRRRKTPDAPRQGIMALTMLFYAGNLSANRDLFATAAINRDDRPLIEYSSPITQRNQRSGAAGWFDGLALSRWLDELARRTPPEADPYLAALRPEERDYVRAGGDLFGSKAQQAAGHADEAKRLADDFGRRVPPEVYQMFAGGKSDAAGEKAP